MKKLLLVPALLAAGTVFAEDGFLDRPSGVKIGSRLTLRPYVSLSYSFDTNPDCGRRGNEKASYWTANPGIDLVYDGDNWKISGAAYYTYHAFMSDYSSSLNNNGFGEKLGYTWSNIVNRGPGWAVLLSESYSKINQNDDFSRDSGKGIWRDRQQFDTSVVIQRRFNEYLYSSVNGSYYWLDYTNDPNSYGPLYGWERWTAGLEVGVMVSKWADVFVAGGYQSYRQSSTRIAAIHNGSDGWTAHVGVSGELTEKLSYRASGGVSTFNYGDVYDATGFTYEGSLNWKITKTLSTSLMASSYYHPSERTAGTAVRCDSVSWGIAKMMVRNKLSTTFDVAYRRDTHVYTMNPAGDWDINMLTARLGVNYVLNRIFTLFARGEYQEELNKGSEIGKRYDYDRFRVTVGLKLTY